MKTESGVRARSDNPRSRGPAPDLSRVQLRSTIDTVTAPDGPPQAFHRSPVGRRLMPPCPISSVLLLARWTSWPISLCDAKRTLTRPGF